MKRLIIHVVLTLLAVVGGFTVVVGLSAILSGGCHGTVQLSVNLDGSK